jgi:hypothetical protein
MEKFSCYEFEVRCHDVPGWGENIDKWVKGYFYVIFDPDYKPCEQTIIRESDEYFDHEGSARLAAIGHITLLENGEG